MAVTSKGVIIALELLQRYCLEHQSCKGCILSESICQDNFERAPQIFELPKLEKGEK